MDDLIRQTPAKRPLARAAELFAQHYEKSAFYILLLWCLLPVIMSLNYFVTGMLGGYPSEAELVKAGLKLGEVNYQKAITVYHTLFYILGAISFCFVLLCLVFCRKRVFSLRSVQKMPWFYLFAGFLVWAGICTIFADNRDGALLGDAYMRDGFVSYCVYGSVFLCASTIRREDYRRKILRCFVAVISYLALIMLIQEATDNAFINYIFSSRRAAVFNQFNHFGYMLCMAIITLVGLFLYDREARKGLRWMYLVGALYLSYALVINNTFGAMLAVIAALPAVLAFYVRSGRKLNRRAVAIILILVLLAGLCFFTLSAGKGKLLRNFSQLRKDLVKIITHAEDAGSAGTNRFGLWRETLRIIERHPILGVGPEGLVRQNALTDNLLPHNTYLQIAAYMGVVGLLIYLAAMLCLAGDRWRYIRRLDPMVLTAAGGALAYLISALVGCPVFNTEPYFWLFLGFTAAAHTGRMPLLCPDEQEEPEEDDGLPSAMQRIVRAFPQQYERMAFDLLLLWCALPIVISIIFLITGALGKYPTEAQILSAGLVPGHVNYIPAVKTYQTLFFILGAFTLLYALLCLVFCRKEVFSLRSVRERPWFYLLGLLLLWALASSLASDYFYHAFAGGTYVRDGLASYFLYAGVFLCASVIRREDYRRHILRAFVAVICYLALIMLIQEATGNAFINYVFSARRAVVFNQFNHFGYMLCMAFACTIGLFLYDRRKRQWQRCLYLALALYLAYALIINNTFGAILASVAAVPVILVFYVRSGRKLNMRLFTAALALIVLVCVCFAAFSSSRNGLVANFTQLWQDLVKIATHAEDAGNAGTGRFALWRDTLQRISERPVFGFGPEGFIGKNAITEEKRPHNEYLQIAGYLGIPALILYLAAILSLAWHQWRRIKKLEPMVLVASGMSVAYLISAVVGNPVYNTAPYFWLFLGLTTGVCAGEKPLLCPEEGTAGAEKRTILFMRLSVLICVVLCLCGWVSLKAEKNRELEDLEAMHAAETNAREYIDPATLHGEIAYYWYDKKKEYLYPAFMAPPEPYGMGSPNSGGTVASFYRDNGFVYNYNENDDYTGKVILVAVAADPDGGLRLALTWGEPKN